MTTSHTQIHQHILYQCIMVTIYHVHQIHLYIYIYTIYTICIMIVRGNQAPPPKITSCGRLCHLFWFLFWLHIHIFVHLHLSTLSCYFEYLFIVCCTCFAHVSHYVTFILHLFQIMFFINTCVFTASDTIFVYIYIHVYDIIHTYIVHL